MKRILASLWILQSLLAPALGADVPVETRAQRDARMAWWRDAKFGMFIHWGVYAVPAGTYQGRQIPGIGEWIMRNAEIPVAEYRAFARQFNPVRYDPAAWAQLARDAGMRYIVITSKHHDGFALFPSGVTDWDIEDATPYGKDLIGPLAQAAREQGLRFGLYYSQAQDWTHPGGAKARLQEGQGWDPAHRGNFDRYLKEIAAPQVREILTRYQPDILWWDTPTWTTPERAAPLYALTALRPGLITNNRLGGGFSGDTETPEQRIPATGFADRDWETCMTLNGTWGYKSYDQNWKSAETLVRNLIDIVSKGGNYLLNVGPTPEGVIPAPSIQRLREVGAWMKVNGEAIYGTTSSPFKKLPWGRCTKKIAPDGATLYLHVFQWPPDGRLLVPGLKSPVTSATLMANGVSLPTQAGPDGLTISLPASAPDPISSTIVLRIQGAPDIKPSPGQIQASDGSVTLPASEATLHGKTIRYEDAHDNLGYWTDPGDGADWLFLVNQPGRFDVAVDVASVGQAAFEIRLDGQTLRVSFPNTGDYTRYRTVPAGTLEIAAPGRTTLRVQPVRTGWRPVNLKSIRLTPSK
ncbi:MAG TPA: alpha-L-fucosidase [Candidatus Paceibacterota bacterium]|nr:alpha-L-fucosidase [Verrucomicrobiota bacterium]HRZ44479.1 alpha-L-fucosidase [Candidatus Paceibacterota bacterium]